MLKLIGSLAEKEGRQKIAIQLAKKLGADNLIIFIKDTELGILLPAPGFPKTLQESGQWLKYLETCVKNKLFTGKIPYPSNTTVVNATGIAYKDECVLVFLGGKIADSDMTTLSYLLPLISSVLNFDEYKIKTHAQILLSDKTVQETQGIAQKLDKARRAAQKALTLAEVESSKRQDAENTLNFQKSVLEAQMEVSPLGILIVSPEGKLLTHNHRFAEMWKFSKNIIESEKDSLALKAAQEQLKNPGQFIKRVHYVYKNRIASNEKIYFKDNRVFDRFGSPLKGKDEAYYGYVWFFLDITEREKLAEQKDEFIGIATHELKTPVTSVKSYAQILQKRFTKEGDLKSAELAGKMDKQLNKLTNLIGDLLDVTKIEGGKLQFNEAVFDFNELVGEIVDELQRTTLKHRIIKKLTKSIDIVADRDRIGQVLTNLISNAIKYSPNADKIIVHTETTKTHVSLCVEDFGVGIPKDKRDKVFERFYRVSGPREITFPGLGLGLFISSEIIKRQGGKIWVDATLGKGSTFCFRLPLKKN